MAPTFINWCACELGRRRVSREHAPSAYLPKTVACRLLRPRGEFVRDSGWIWALQGKLWHFSVLPSFNLMSMTCNVMCNQDRHATNSKAMHGHASDGADIFIESSLNTNVPEVPCPQAAIATLKEMVSGPGIGVMEVNRHMRPAAVGNNPKQANSPKLPEVLLEGAHHQAPFIHVINRLSDTNELWKVS